ncbi:hypothetical protein [Aquimarina megaterium]|uniref:hypothetical protein n=1 Tax=Aquimarina megaterium TaxID=1443666 RepID=UPI000471B366|nr:hypothetical protein [Aquimarina megaterium]
MRIKNLIATFLFFLVSLAINAQTVWYDVDDPTQAKIGEEPTVQQKSTNNQEDSDLTVNPDPISIIDNLSTNTINQANGKVHYTVPITEITSNRLKAGLNLSFNGDKAIKNVEYSNKIKATGIVGLGWSINTSKIIADNKQTGYRDDDEFFLLEGGLKKLICTKKVSPNLYEFKVENLPNWNVTYYRNHNYWLIVKENGDRYFYGDSNASVNTNANENIIHWNNWIGNSRATGGALQTFTWNLSKISNQWEDQIQFYYQTIDQAIQADNLGPKHTEASYLVKIESNSGDKIELNYLNKMNTATVQEYYEPNTDISEPDAYQERYEKKYLDNVILKRDDGEILMKYQLTYETTGVDSFAKRYLTQITTYNKNNESLNPQIFVYNTTGIFKGTIHKIKNTTGSEVTYQYENKLLHNNAPKVYLSGFQNSNGYEIDPLDPNPTKGEYFSLNDGNALVKYVPAVSGNAYFLIRTWDGKDWRGKKLSVNHTHELSNHRKTFIGKNYFGYYFKEKIRIFSLDKDGYSWKQNDFEISIPPEKVKSLITNDDYVLIISTEGKILPLVQNGSEWQKMNSFNGSNTNSISNINVTGNHLNFTWYYIDPNTNVRHLVSRNVISFQMDHSFRIEPYTFSGSASGSYPQAARNINLSDIIFTENDFSNKFVLNRIYKNLNKGFNFYNGKQWFEYKSSSTNDYHKIGINRAYKSKWIGPGNYDSRFIILFDPNLNTFSEMTLPEPWNYSYPWQIGDYTLTHKKIYKSNTTNLELVETYNTDQSNSGYKFYKAKSMDKTIIQKVDDGLPKNWYLYIDKKDGSIKKTIWDDYQNIILFSDEYFLEKKVVEGKTLLYIQRFHENKINKNVYDIVVKSININNGFDDNIITSYSYNNPNILANNAIYYAEVTEERKGAGNSSLGRTLNYYDTGSNDIRKAGLLTRTEVKDTEGKIITSSNNELIIGANLYSNNSVNKPIHIGNRLLLNKKTNESHFYNDSNHTWITTTQKYEYNNKGLTSKIITNDSEGKKQEQNIEYAFQNSIAFINSNMIDAISKRIYKSNNKITGISFVEWANESGKLYPKKEYNGPNGNSLRLQSEITRISNKGVIEETTNGKDLYAVNLSAYNDKRSVASIDNARFNDVINNLDVTYSQLQNLTTDQLKIELKKLYDRLPNAMIKLSFYDNNGSIISEIDARQEEINYHYDNFNRLDYVSDKNNNVLKKNIYNYKAN